MPKCGVCGYVGEMPGGRCLSWSCTRNRKEQRREAELATARAEGYRAGVEAAAARLAARASWLMGVAAKDALLEEAEVIRAMGEEVPL